MKISIIGAGYVGLVSGVGLAKHGHEVTCVDIDKEVVESINEAQPPIYEKGLDDLLEVVVSSGKLKATTDLEEAVEKTEMTFICVGTPSREDGSIDTGSIESVAEEISEVLSYIGRYHVVVVKSTVTPGTTDGDVKEILESSGKKAGESFGLGMNPEFLREGVALDDFLDPDRIVIGGCDDKTREKIEKVYESFNVPKLVTDIRTAEMIKYASNALLATKISFANEMSRLCEEKDIDVYEVMDGVGLDHRLKRDFLNAGPGFGGSCFPKDVRAIRSLAKEEGLDTDVLDAVLSVNEEQPLHTVDLLEKEIGDLKGKRVAVLGLAFKGGTDDIRETRALPIVEKLVEKGADVVGYDPKAMENFSELIDEMEFAGSSSEALESADACIIQNDWDEFKNMSVRDFSTMNKKVVLDGRRVLDCEKIDKEITYLTIGK